MTSRTGIVLLSGTLLLATAWLASADVWSDLPRTHLQREISSMYGGVAEGLAGPSFRNVRDYGARGDGITDDTQAFLRALDTDRGGPHVRFKTPASLYIPPGVYLLSDTLILWTRTLVAGDSADPPTLVLKAHSPGFDDPATPKPFLVTSAGLNFDFERETPLRDWTLQRPDLGGWVNTCFHVTLRHVSIRIEPGNPGAWGLYWLVGQQTALRHVTIDAGEAQGCLRTMRGGGGILAEVTLRGGDYGWHAGDTTSQWVARGLQLTGQRLHSLWLDRVWSFAFVGLHLQDTAPAQLEGGQVAIFDSEFDEIRGEAVFRTSPESSLVLRNTRTRGVPQVVAGRLPAAQRGETSTSLWLQGTAMVDGVELAGAHHDLTPYAELVPRDLPQPPYPMPSPACRSVCEFGARGDWVTDDTAALQRALGESDELFFPHGRYRVTDTLVLRSSHRLFGDAFTVVILDSTAPDFQDPTSLRPLLEIPDDPEATLTLCHLHFDVRSPGGLVCDWRAGEHSAVVDCSFGNHRTQGLLNWRISGRGGGFFENMWNAVPGAFPGDGLEITSTGQKWLYAVQQEHYGGTALRLRQARRLFWLIPQFETSSRYVEMDDCGEVVLVGTLAGNWLAHVNSVVHITGGTDLALINSIACRAQHVISEAPHGWNAGPPSESREQFSVQGLWLKR